MDFKKQVQLVKESKLVHGNWYKQQYPDVEMLGMQPVEHYLKYGAYLGRDPSKKFCTNDYKKQVDISDNLNPLIHYIQSSNKLDVGVKSLSKSNILLNDAKRKIEYYSAKLLTLGFTEQPIRDLLALSESEDNVYLKPLVYRELAIWLIRQKSESNYKEAYNYLCGIKSSELDLNIRRDISVLKLLCCYFLGLESDANIIFNESCLEGLIDSNILFAWANNKKAYQDRLNIINYVLNNSDLEKITLTKDENIQLYDRMSSIGLSEAENGPLVTILVASYNAENTILTTLSSLKKQTWKNIEVIIIDDFSQDKTCNVVSEFCFDDPRFKLLSLKENGGAYIARNEGLKISNGKYVTLNDSDDWSHPRKIEIQVSFLESNQNIIGCTSEQARVTPDLIFDSIRKSGSFLIPNISSFMYRRKEVLDKVGYWDRVRFGADIQFINRIRKAFGRASVVNLNTGPLSFQRKTPESATGSDYFGYDGFKFGARKAYEDAQNIWLNEARNCYLPIEPKERPFFAPDPMRPKRANNNRQPRKFDVIIASDFRFDGGTSSSNAEEIKAQKYSGLKTGLIELGHYNFGMKRDMNEKVRSLIDGESVDLLVYGEEVECDVLIVRQPMVLEHNQRYIPKVNAKVVRVIVNQPPQRDYSTAGEVLYSIPNCVDNMKSMFGSAGVWHPIGPLVRNALIKYHLDDMKIINLSEYDWTNIIDAIEWRRTTITRGSKNRLIKIGRHSRDQYVKWPTDINIMELIYPRSPEFEIHVLGGAESPREVYGGNLPENWRVHSFGAMHPADFLATIDVFVYFTHPDWIEAFGRVIFEPMVVGVPVILPHVYQELFGDAALYAEPHEVKELVTRLVNEPVFYNMQVSKALQIVKDKFSHQTHLIRLNRID